MSLISNLKDKNFLALWISQLISQFGNRVNQMALVGLVAGSYGGNAMDLAKVLTFTIIPVFVVGPLAGVYVDRWDRKLTMMLCDIIRGALVLTIPLFFMQRASIVPIYVIVFLVFCLTRFHVPAKMSIIPEIVCTEHLHAANSLATVTGMIAFVLGALFGGLLVEHIGPRGGFLVDALMYFSSAALLIFITRPHLKRPEHLGRTAADVAKAYRSVWHDMREGVRYILSQRDVRYMMQLMMVLFMAAGAVYVVIIVFIQESFGSLTKHLGFLAVGLGVGLFLGSLAYGKWGKKEKNIETIFICLIAGGLMIAVFTLAVSSWRNIWMAQALALLLGFIVGPIVIAANTLVHSLCPAHMQGKVFTALEIVIHFGFLVAMLGSSQLSQYIGKMQILIAVGAVFCIVGVAGYLRYRGSREK